VTGDVTQVDLPGGTRSGLKVVREILDGVEDVHFAILSSADVVRHRLVSDIVDAYERWDAVQEADEAQPIRAVPGRGGHPGHPGRGARRR
jgi:phosphate starvation-inducible PhoH-like protein